MKLVKELMTKNLVTIKESENFEKILDILANKEIGSVIITNGKNKVVQILTLRDIAKVLVYNWHSLKISEVLKKLNKSSKDLITVKENQDILTALKLLNKYKISHLPVVSEKNKIVGILSIKDIIKNFPSVIYIDPLTKLTNRAYLEALITKFQYIKSCACLLMVDIDNFKKVNDTYGHLTGDKVLQELAKVLRSNIKASDEIIRFGGEEFLIILYRTDKEKTLKIAERLRTAVKNTLFIAPGGEKFHITISIGISCWKPGENFIEKIKESDEAMYLAKKAGKDCVKMKE